MDSMTPNPHERISPTAHYTGYVWHLNGLSHPAFVTGKGRLMHMAMSGLNRAASMAGAASLDAMLLARHRIIDHLLEQRIASGEISQVVEIAAGLSPRGWRFTQKHSQGQLTYVEGDLPGMVARKKAMLEQGGISNPRHIILEVDALVDEGANALARLTNGVLDPRRGTAIITEGLVGYFGTEDVRGMWARFGRFLSLFPTGVYLSDLHLTGEVRGFRATKAFEWIIATTVRKKIALPFHHADEASKALTDAGFRTAHLHKAKAFADTLGLHDARSGGLVRIVEAAVSK